MYICMYICTYAYIYVHVHIHIYMYMYICMCTYVHVYVHMYVCAYIYIYMYIYTRIYKYIHIRINILSWLTLAFLFLRPAPPIVCHTCVDLYAWRGSERAREPERASHRDRVERESSEISRAPETESASCLSFVCAYVHIVRSHAGMDNCWHACIHDACSCVNQTFIGVHHASPRYSVARTHSMPRSAGRFPQISL